MRLHRCVPAIVLLALTTVVGPAAAHETQSAGSFHLSVGWSDEPAFTGSRNAVELVVSNASDGSPIADAKTALQVEVIFGEHVVVLTLSPSGRAGTFLAPLVPTQAGHYTFHVTGTVGTQPVDVTSTCSDQTFECVRDVADIQFPTRDPSGGQLAELSSRVVDRADRAAETARTARLVALAAVVVAVLALALAAGLGWRRRARRG